MKKIYSSILIIIVIFLSACEPETVYVNVPGPTEYVEVIKEVEV